MGNCNIIKYIDAFQKELVYCFDVHEAKTKFFFKNNIAN